MLRRRRNVMKMQNGGRFPVRAATVAAAAFAVCGLLLVGCGGESSSAGSAGMPVKRATSGARSTKSNAVPDAAVPAVSAVPAVPGAARSGSSQTRPRAALPLAAGSDIIYTASLTVRARDVAQADAQAQQIVTGVGGYVASESTSIDPSHPARSRASLELKIPVGAYPATLTKLTTQVGSQVSLRQQAQDVTETVADTNSRVASAEAAMSQLRTLLGRAGAVSELLSIQEQISQQESDLESLQAQQRALNHQTAYATVSLQLLGASATVKPRRHHHAAGFVGGLTAGWRALRSFASGLSTVLGALIPFAVVLVVLGYLGYRNRRWLFRRRTPPTPAD